MAKKATITKKWYESKTVWLGVITAIVGIFSFLESQYPQMGIFVTLSGVMGIVLRVFSSTPIE